MKTFDLGGFLAHQEEVSKLDTPAARERYEQIDIDQLDPDPENFYSMDGLEKLAENILLCGLLQPLRVKPGTKPGRYTVMAGHRRRAAIRRLVDEGHEEFRLVPCVRDGGGCSDTLQELKLIYANSDTRDLTAAELSKQAQKTELLLYRLKEEGFAFPGRMRDHVAEVCRISAPKLARLKVIREGLIPAYMELFDRDKLPEQTAYALARLPVEFQERLCRVLDKPPAGAKAEKLLAKYDDGWRWEPELTCPDGKSCKRGDTFLRRDCESSGRSEMCGGNTCCLNCDMAKQAYSPCERMCSKARAAMKISDCSTGFLLGLTEELVPAALTQQKFADAAEVQRAGSGSGPVRYEDPCEQCKKAHPGCDKCCKDCSDHCNAWQACRQGETDRPADDTSHGEVWHWWPETPAKSGLYWCVTGPLTKGGGLYWWEASTGQWEHAGAKGVLLTLNIVLWMACPELPETMRWDRPELSDG